jgi:mono/diheme cytochrome c family protein
MQGKWRFLMARRTILPILALWGCHVIAADPPAPSPTFYRNILPILQRNCQSCHRPGEIGPMPLLSYQEVRPWAKSIKTNVLNRKMPPWFADPKFGHYQNDRRLKQAELNQIVAWVDAGAPEGDPKTAPKPVEFPDGWNIQADEIFQMPDPMMVPQKEPLNYVYVVIPTGFRRDTWVTAAEIRPGDRSVVHHVLAVVRPPGSRWMMEAKPFVPYIPPAEARDGEAPDPNDPQSRPVDTSFELLAAYAPGAGAQRFDVDQSAKLVPAGSDIVLQIHYTPNGKYDAKDQTRVGLSLAKGMPRKRFMSAVANAWKWEIPPGDPNYEAHGRLTFGEPVELVFLQPHMHVRGKDMRVDLVYPNGKTETLLNVPKYDFNWQTVYYLEKPLQLPEGTRVEITAHWDNSANNPYNPDPTKSVKWGNQSWDEMLSLPMGVVIDLE